MKSLAELRAETDVAIDAVRAEERAFGFILVPALRAIVAELRASVLHEDPVKCVNAVLECKNIDEAVQKRIAEAVEAEREACAKAIDPEGAFDGLEATQALSWGQQQIRARSKKDNHD